MYVTFFTGKKGLPKWNEIEITNPQNVTFSFTKKVYQSGLKFTIFINKKDYQVLKE